MQAIEFAGLLAQVTDPVSMDPDIYILGLIALAGAIGLLAVLALGLIVWRLTRKPR